MKKIVNIVIALFLAGALTVQIVEAQQAGIKRTPLQQVDLSVPGREVVQVRVEFEPGASFPNHTHPGEEIIYVIEGTFDYVIAGKTYTAKAGEVLFVPAGAVHSAKNTGTTKAAGLATYIIEKGKPLLTLAK